MLLIISHKFESLETGLFFTLYFDNKNTKQGKRQSGEAGPAE